MKSKTENRNVKVQNLTATFSLARSTVRRDRDVASCRKTGLEILWPRTGFSNL
jgi:hypothetical protein